MIPDFAADFPKYANYTVEELLRMQTLVPEVEYETDVLFQGDVTIRFDSVTEVIPAALKSPPYPAKYGTYSSTNFMVMDVIVETLFNTTMQQMLQEKILTPLGLEQTVLPLINSDGFRPEPAAIPYAIPRCAEALNYTYGFPNVSDYQDINDISRIIVWSSSGGSMVSNLQDLLTWTKTGLGDDLLSEEMVARRHDRSTPLEEGLLLYGIGQYNFSSAASAQFGGDGWYGHDGGTYGYASKSAINRDVLEGAAFVGAVNSCESASYLKLFDIYNDDLRKRMAMSTSPTTDTTTSGSRIGSNVLGLPAAWSLVVIGLLGLLRSV